MDRRRKKQYAVVGLFAAVALSAIFWSYFFKNKNDGMGGTGIIIDEPACGFQFNDVTINADGELEQNKAFLGQVADLVEKYETKAESYKVGYSFKSISGTKKEVIQDNLTTYTKKEFDKRKADTAKEIKEKDEYSRDEITNLFHLYNTLLVEKCGKQEIDDKLIIE